MATLTFSEALFEAEWLARSAMPDRAERIDQAVRLVKGGKVFQLDDTRTWEVDSTSIPGKRYTVNGHCNCDDAHYRKDVCKHAMAVLLSRKVLKLMTPPTMPQTPPATRPMVQLLEAPVSANVRVHLDGREILLTLRGTDEVEVLTRVAKVIALYPDTPVATQPFHTVNRSGSQNTETPQCPAHGAMKQSTKGKGWYCPHKTADGQWCSSKGH